MTVPTNDPEQPRPDTTIEALHHAEQRLVRTVDSLGDADWAGPTILPDWTRAHVVAHLALNAEGFARALHGLLDGAPVPIYDSQERRDADVEQLAGEPPQAIRDRLFAAGWSLRERLLALQPEQWTRTVERVPGGPDWPVRAMPRLRRREVEMHHADLGAGYSPADWPAAFTTQLLGELVTDHTLSPDSPPFAVRAVDVDRSWELGAGAPVVRGTAATLSWWLAGRGAGDGLSANGDLPHLGPWRMAPVE